MWPFSRSACTALFRPTQNTTSSCCSTLARRSQTARRNGLSLSTRALLLRWHARESASLCANWCLPLRVAITLCRSHTHSAPLSLSGRTNAPAGLRGVFQVLSAESFIATHKLLLHTTRGCGDHLYICLSRPQEAAVCRSAGRSASAPSTSLSVRATAAGWPAPCGTGHCDCGHMAPSIPLLLCIWFIIKQAIKCKKSLRPLACASATINQCRRLLMVMTRTRAPCVHGGTSQLTARARRV